MKVDRALVSRYSIPLSPPVGDSTHGTIHTFTLVTVRLFTPQGVEGTGYTYTVGEAGGGAIAAILDADLAPLVVGRDPRCVERLWQSMWQSLHYVGRGGPASFAISAMDVALWDLKAKLSGEPLWRLLGGCEPRVPAYAGGIDLNLSPEALEAQTEANLSKGFRAIKMKVGLPRLSDDIDRVRRVRSVVGPDTPLMVDANMKWTVAQAIRASRALAEHEVYWLEEPTAPSDVNGHARIQAEGAVPVAAGENLHTLEEFESMISRGGVAFAQGDVSNCGGITSWLKIAHLAEARNLPISTHGVHELHVSLLAAVPNASYLEVHGFGLESYVKRPMRFAAGCAMPFDAAGHGVEFRWSALEPYIRD